MSPKLKHGLRGSVLHGEIYAYLKTNPIGRVMFEVDHFLPNDPGNTRRPDVSFITNQRLERLTNEDAVPFMPDLAIEVKSPANYYTGKAGLRGKAQYYLAHGSRLVWLVDPDRYTIEVYAPGQSVRTLSMDDTLSGGDVLPGFHSRCARSSPEPPDDGCSRTRCGSAPTAPYGSVESAPRVRPHEQRRFDLIRLTLSTRPR
ncbi:MAG: Uma2 family endonuclease [Chloroflexi bacterium]|nr:Uma2 family endonuclease [Chloroflexota bacterium]